MRFAGNVEADHVSFPALMTRRFLWFAAISLAHVWLFAWLLHGRIVQQIPPQDALTIWAVPAVARLLPEATKPAPKPASEKSPTVAAKKPVNPDLKADAVNLPLFTEPSPNIPPLEAKSEAIARAIVTEPAVLLADEPTGNLDTKRSREIMDLLARLNANHGITVLMVTHELDMALYTKRMLHFIDGALARDEINPHPTPFELEPAVHLNLAPTFPPKPSNTVLTLGQR